MGQVPCRTAPQAVRAAFTAYRACTAAYGQLLRRSLSNHVMPLASRLTTRSIREVIVGHADDCMVGDGRATAHADEGAVTISWFTR